MTTTATTSTPATSPVAAAGTAAASQAAFDSSGFLNILMAEMQNQDPTQPSDPTQWATQYAQMTGVQQSVLTNQKLDGLLTEQALSQASGAVGRTVQSADGSISGKIVSVQLNGTVLQATLDSGQSLQLGSGITFS
jgi:flagellar basal-body rod modification protein FlgD